MSSLMVESSFTSSTRSAARVAFGSFGGPCCAIAHGRATETQRHRANQITVGTLGTHPLGTSGTFGTAGTSLSRLLLGGNMQFPLPARDHRRRQTVAHHV